MESRIPQSVAKLVVFKAFLATDHVTAATGKTIAMQVSQNGGAFANFDGGALNATQIANGWYKAQLQTADTDTKGPLIVRGTEGTIDPAEVVYHVVNATNADFTALPAAVADANNGLVTGDGSVTFTAGVGNRLAVDAEGISGSTAAADAVEAVFTGAGAAADVDLEMRSLVINNDAGPGFYIGGTTFGMEVTASNGPGISSVSTGGNNAGIVATGNDSGAGVVVTSGNTPTADALTISGQASGIYVTGDTAVIYEGTAGPGLQSIGTTFGAEFSASNGPAISGVSTGGNGDGMLLTKHGTGKDLNADIGGTIDVCTTNSDMVGTDGAALASVLGTAVGASISADLAAVKAETVLIVEDTNEFQTTGVFLSTTGWDTVLADGVAGSLMISSLVSVLMGETDPSGSTVVFKKRDGSTTLVTVIHNIVGDRTSSTIVGE